MSRKLDVAVALLFIAGMWHVFGGLSSLFSLIDIESMWLEPAGVEVTVSQIRDFSPNLMDFVVLTIQFYGLLNLTIGLFVCVTCLIPYRRGEKWAWYAMLIIVGITAFGMSILSYISMPFFVLPSLIHVILWIVGLTLPAKEILGKPS